LLKIHRLQILKTVICFGLALSVAGCFPVKPTADWATSLEGVYSATFSNDGEYAVIGSMRHGGSLWRVTDTERLYNWNHAAAMATNVTATAFSPDGKFAVTADETTLVLWDVSGGESLRYFNSPGPILSLGLTPNADKALLALTGGNAVLFDIRNGGIIAELPQGGEIQQLSISADGRSALIGTSAKKAKLWNLITAELLLEIDTRNPISALDLSPDGRLAFIAEQLGDARIWNLESNDLVITLNYRNTFFPNYSHFKTARFSEDGSHLLTGSSSGAMEL